MAEMTAGQQSQVVGLALGLATAIGCIFYEKLVLSLSFFGWLITFKFLEWLILIPLGWYLLPHDVTADLARLRTDWKLVGQGLLCVAMSCTSLFWYMIVRRQSVMAGAVYEVKYIVMLAVIYMIFGSKPVNLNTLLGIAFAMVSVYFVSRS